MLFAQAQSVLSIVVTVVVLLFGAVCLIVSLRYFRVWMRGYMSGVPLTILQILGMEFRRTDVKAVLRALIMARQAGVAVSPREMEIAYLQGIDLEKITLAAIEAKRQNLEYTFQELVDADLKNRLREKLGIGSR